MTIATNRDIAKSIEIRMQSALHLVEDSNIKYKNRLNIIEFIKENYPDELEKLLEQKILECKVEIAPSIYVYAISWGRHIFVSSSNEFNTFDYERRKALDTEDVKPFITFKVIGKAYREPYKIDDHRYGYGGYDYHRRPQFDSYQSYNYDNRQYDLEPYNYVKADIGAILTDHPIYGIKTSTNQIGIFKFQRPDGGVIDLALPAVPGTIIAQNDFYGIKSSWTIKLIHKDWNGSNKESWPKISGVLKNFKIIQGKSALLEKFFDAIIPQQVETKGIKALEKQKDIKLVLDKLSEDARILWKFYLALHENKVRDGVSNNQLLAAVLKDCGNNYDKLKETLQLAFDKIESIYIKDGARTICMLFPQAQSLNTKKKAETQWHLRETAAAQAEGLGIIKEKYPLLFEHVSDRKIPISIFHEPGSKDDLINSEFPIWERALARKGWPEIICSIAANAASRKQYKKDITPYIAFLFKIEQYLEKCTGYIWKSMPKLVNSEWELEMAEADEGVETVKRRSALTPIADNDKKIITVPYASLAIHGRQTTYCYSLHYFVLEENTLDDESGTVAVRDFEPKLNGRDDYGLMYYTLTGSVSNRGYPTFLIIFERLKRKTRVHFHRVHPNKYKGGKATPAWKLVEECYRYMAGNIRAEEIYAQQGDLIFIKMNEAPKHEPEELKGISDFESHEFQPSGEQSVKLIENTAKSIRNRLGYIYSDSTFTVDHPEHDPIKNLPAGWYEVRRCKSWEANPKAVWSFTID